MQSKNTLGKAARSLGSLFFALTFLLTAVAVGFGGTAFFIYHQLNDSGDVTRKAANRAATERRLAEQGRTPVDAPARPRQVALTPLDKPSYTYADNVNGRASTPAPRSRSTPTNVPAPLEAPTVPAVAANNAPYLSDPESRYIVDARTGRIIGVDGSAGATLEEQQRQEQVRSQEELLRTAPRAIPVQTLAPEVRVAVPVIAEGRPVYTGIAPDAPTPAPGSQYVPVRRALPVNDVPVGNTFSVSGELSDDNRPVLRAQPVLVAGQRR